MEATPRNERKTGGKCRTRVFKPELSCIFEDVTNESIINDDLIEALGNALRKGGSKRLAELLLSKHVAAPETS